VNHRYAPFQGNCPVCIPRFHVIELIEKVEDRKAAGFNLIEWFRKIKRHFTDMGMTGNLWDDNIYHRRYLVQLHELYDGVNWMSLDQRLEVMGCKRPVTDASLRRTATLSPSRQLGAVRF